MNKMKKSILYCFFSLIISLPCIAADETLSSGVSNRMSCTEIQERINELSKIENASEDITAELTMLQSRYRSDCSKSASGRKTIGRVSALSAAPSVDTTPVVTEVVNQTPASVLNTFLENQESNCTSLKNSIEDFKKDTSVSADDLKKLEKQYSDDCAKYDDTIVIEEEVDPEKVSANLAAGLCADGSKPNRFGCCEGETFKDLGNLVFACCPNDGGECYPPLTTGSLL